MRKQILKMQEGESFPFCWVKFDSDSCIGLLFSGQRYFGRCSSNGQ